MVAGSTPARPTIRAAARLFLALGFALAAPLLHAQVTPGLQMPSESLQRALSGFPRVDDRAFGPAFRVRSGRYDGEAQAYRWQLLPGASGARPALYVLELRGAGGDALWRGPITFAQQDGGTLATAAGLPGPLLEHVEEAIVVQAPLER